jgi:hypothetical protein
LFEEREREREREPWKNHNAFFVLPAAPCLETARGHTRPTVTKNPSHQLDKNTDTHTHTHTHPKETGGRSKKLKQETNRREGDSPHCRFTPREEETFSSALTLMTSLPKHKRTKWDGGEEGEGYITFD